MSLELQTHRQTTGHCSLAEKIKMIELKANGKPISSISEEMNRDEMTVRRWLTRWKNESAVEVRPRSGRKRKMSELDEAKMLVFLQTNQSATLREIKTKVELECSLRTINDYLKANKVHSFNAPLKPSHFPHHLVARLSFAKFVKKWSLSKWERVIFSDESSFRNHRSCARKVWRMRGVEGSVKASMFAATKEIRINVWGAISVDGIFSLKKVANKFDGLMYLHVLEEVMPQLSQKRPTFIWMQDNASIHERGEVLDYFEHNEIPRLMWPARSPDLNPIENLWGYITRKLDAMVDANGEATTEDELWQRVQRCANETSTQFFKNLYESLLKRVKLVIEKDGFFTKY